MSQVVNSESAQLVETNHSQVARYAPLVEIEIEKLGINTARLVRPIDNAYVAELVESDETEWPALEICVWDDSRWVKPVPSVEYEIVSGNHRTSAARIKDLKTLRATIIEAPTELDYMLAAISTNARHGRNFTENERRMNAAKLKTLGMGTSEIAKLFGVHRSTVKNWLSGRDTNASKKEKKETALHMLASAESDRVDEDWRAVPEASVSDREMVQARTKIHNFLAETPVDVEKSHVIAWIRSLSLEMRQAHTEDMRETLRWLQNVAALLEGTND